MNDFLELSLKAKNIRRDILISLNKAGSGHLGGSLGLADVFTALYFNVLNHDPKNFNDTKRDKLVLSIGHVAPVLYASLAHAGYFPLSELYDLRKLNSRLQGHPSISSKLPGLETSSGSLGQGLSIAVGMSLADKIDNNYKRKIYCVCGDGEMQEGQIWEAAMSAAHHKLNNLRLIIDKNNVQIDGKTEEVMNINPLEEKLVAFGWKVDVCNGNDIADIVNKLKITTDKPFALIANTKMGKGVKEIEDDYSWHGKVPNDEELNRFLDVLY